MYLLQSLFCDERRSKWAWSWSWSWIFQVVHKAFPFWVIQSAVPDNALDSFFWNWPRYCAWNRGRVLGSEVRGSVFLQSATLCSLMSSAVHCAGKLEYYFSSIQPSIWCQIRTCPTKEFHSLFYDLWTICEIWYIYHEGYPRPTKIPTGGVVDFQKLFNWFRIAFNQHTCPLISTFHHNF